MCIRDRTKEAIKRRYGVDVTDESESAPDTRGAGMDPARDMVTQNIAYYRNKQGGIGRFSWVNDVVLEDYADYQARRLHRCKKCGENGDGNQMCIRDRDIAIMRGRVAEGTPWIARDDDGDLEAYKEKPERLKIGWYTDDDYYDINNDLLSWIKPGECVDLREILDEVDKDG